MEKQRLQLQIRLRKMLGCIKIVHLKMHEELNLNSSVRDVLILENEVILSLDSLYIKTRWR